FTSPYSKTVSAPVHISLNDLKDELKPELFNQGWIPVAYLLEGAFTSLFKNRFLPKGMDKNLFLPDGKPSRIIVCSDGDLLRNEINPRSGQPYELGYDPFMQNTFANGDFLENSLAYLFEEDGLILARNKEIKIRPLDSFRIKVEKQFWQVLNLFVPLAILMLIGILKFYLRKRKYTRF
ncbi:MAG: hypothetical protein KAT15_27685, partial [Bacteroidales bacterium]|nr:hypothetical protein [Bacteroidales bacterium]